LPTAAAAPVTIRSGLLSSMLLSPIPSRIKPADRVIIAGLSPANRDQLHRARELVMDGYRLLDLPD
jgi:hypothetical protein